MDRKLLTKILFVDDDKDTLIIARYCLKNLKDIEVRYVSSGEAAIQETLQFQPNLILLDVMMPKMDGMAVLKAIRQMEETAHIPVVFFTAKVQKEEVSSYLKAGVIDVIQKPFDPLALSAMIEKIWKNYQAT